MKFVILVPLVLMHSMPVVGTETRFNSVEFFQSVLYQNLLKAGRAHTDAYQMSKRLSRNPRQRVVSALSLMNKGCFEEANLLLRSVSRTDPLFAESRLWAALCQFRAGSDKEAFAFFRSAESTMRNKRAVYLNRSVAYSQIGNHQAALRDLKLATNAKGTCEHLQCEAWGKFYQATGEYEKALFQFQKAAMYEPKYGDAYLGAADCLLCLRKKPMSLLMYSQAVGADPTSPLKRLFLGLALEDQGLSKNALIQYDIAQGIAPQFPKVHELKGDSFLSLRNWKSAIEEYTKVKYTAESRPVVATGSSTQKNDQIAVKLLLKTAESEIADVSIKRTLNLLPPNLEKRLQMHGVSVIVAPSVEDFVNSMPKQKQPDFSIAPSCVRGLYISRTKEVIIGLDSLALFPMDDLKNAELLLHELGHAFDELKSNASRGLYFKLAYARDCNSLSLDKQEHFRQYFESHFRGCRDLFADLFASKVLKKQFGNTDEHFSHLFPSFFPNCSAVVDVLLEERRKENQ